VNGFMRALMRRCNASHKEGVTREALNRCAASGSAPLFDPSCHAK
jgi:hypothetical protein